MDSHPFPIDSTLTLPFLNSDHSASGSSSLPGGGGGAARATASSHAAPVNFDALYGDWVHTAPTPPPPAGVDRATIGQAVASVQQHHLLSHSSTSILPLPAPYQQQRQAYNLPSIQHHMQHQQLQAGIVDDQLRTTRFSPYGLGTPEFDSRNMEHILTPFEGYPHGGYTELRPMASTSGIGGGGGPRGQQHLAPAAASSEASYMSGQHSLSCTASSSASPALLSPPLPPSTSSSRPIAGKSRRSLVGPSSATAMAPPPVAAAAPPLTASSLPRKSPRTPQQPTPSDESSVPEAALHLLRLALPSGSTGGSVATNASASTTTTAAGDEDASCDEDAEGESDATSLHSADEFYGDSSKGVGQQLYPGLSAAMTTPSVANATKPGGSRRTSSNASSVASVRSGRGHRPARTQREMSTSTRAGSEDGRGGGGGGGGGGPSPGGGRRTSGRVRKTVVTADPKVLFDSDSDTSMNGGGDYSSDDEGPPSVVGGGGEDDEGEYAGGELGGKKGKKGKGKAKATPRSVSTASTNSGSTSSKASTKRSVATMSTTSTSTTASGSAPKKPRLSGPAQPRRPRRIAAPSNTPNRTFPPEVDISPAFPRLYRTFPVSSAFPPESYVHRLRSVSNDLHPHFPAQQHAYPPGFATASGDDTKLPEIRNFDDVVFTMDPPEGSKWNKASDPFNLYAPRFVKGNADEKCGLCPICIEPVARGGEGVEKWLKLKNSSYVYHMSYAHGLSNLTGLPFSPPIKVRTNQLKPATKDARDHMTEGLCHKCNNWIPLLSVKNVEAVVPELIWWKHAKPCHGNSSLLGEGDYYVRDAVFDLVTTRKNAHLGSHAALNSAPVAQQAQMHQGSSHASGSG